MTFVEPPVSVTSTPGASSSVILTSTGSGVVDSPWRPTDVGEVGWADPRLSMIVHVVVLVCGV